MYVQINSVVFFFQNLILNHLDLKKLEFWYKQVKSRVRLELCLPESNFPWVANCMMFKGRLLQTVETVKNNKKFLLIMIVKLFCSLLCNLEKHISNKKK